MSAGDAPISRPVVPATVYDAEYYLHKCAGAEEWSRSGGRQLDPLYEGSLRRAGLAAGDVVVDLGTGRGELLVAAVRLGASLAVGAEYSADALSLVRQTLFANGVGRKAMALAADVRRLPLPAACADLVTMLDIVEHLTPDELHATFVEAQRVLRPGGRVFVHTLPNRLVYSVTYRWQRALRPDRWLTWPADPRVELERVMHVNEQTPASLHRALRRAGLQDVSVELGAMVHDAFVPDERARRMYHRLAKRRLTARFGAADLWGTGFAGG